MKIAYCIAATYNSGGMERVLANKANWLARHGHEVTIITTDQAGRTPYFPLNESIATYDLCIDYEANNGRSFLNKLATFPLRQWRHRRRLRRLLAELKPDITVSMFNNDAPLLASIPEGGRKVLEVHFSRFKRLQYGRKGLWALADRWRSRKDARTARRFDRFVVLTRQDSRYWGDIDGMTVIPNASSFLRTDPAPLDRRRVIAVGRLSHQKGFDRLIDAWSRIAPDAPGWQLRIIGSGPLKEELMLQCRRLALTDSIEFADSVTDMPAAYADASILAMTSRYEGLPMALIEAQTCGLPIVCMDCKCGPRDVVTDGFDGFVTPEDDVDAFTRRLAMLIHDDELRRTMGAAAFEASLRFDTEAIMKRWTDLFNSLTK